jgi:hypothetical protein
MKLRRRPGCLTAGLEFDEKAVTRRRRVQLNRNFKDLISGSYLHFCVGLQINTAPEVEYIQ